MTLPVKHFHSNMQGAPQLSNDWGCMTALLDACLVTGFNTKAVSSITRVGTVATASIAAGHLFEVGQVLVVSGADQAAYNGEVCVVSVTTTTFTYAVTGSPVTPATGASLSVKVAPLGWEIAFTGTNKRAYRSLNILSNRPYLRVDDGLDPVWTTAYAKYAKVTMAQGMTDIDTFVGARAPFDSALPTKNEIGSGSGSNAYGGWHKWYYAKTDAGSANGHTDTNDPGAFNRAWVIVGDDRGFYLFNQWGNSVGGLGGHCFTDFESYRTADGFNTLLAATDAYVPAAASLNQGPDGSQCFPRTLDYTGKVLMRDYTQVGSNVRVGFCTLNTNNNLQSVSGTSTGIPWPNGPDYSLILHPVLLKQENNHLRGKLPGMMWIHNNSPSFSHLDVITDVVGYPGSKFLVVKTTASNGYYQELAMLAFDITGPWW